MIKKFYCLMVLLFAITVGAQNIVWPTDATAQEVYHYINNLLQKGSYQATLHSADIEIIIKQQSNDDGSIWVWTESISSSQTTVSLTNSDGCFLIHEEKSIKVAQSEKDTCLPIPENLKLENIEYNGRPCYILVATLSQDQISEAAEALRSKSLLKEERKKEINFEEYVDAITTYIIYKDTHTLASIEKMSISGKIISNIVYTDMVINPNFPPNTFSIPEDVKKLKSAFRETEKAPVAFNLLKISWIAFSIVAFALVAVIAYRVFVKLRRG